MGLAKEISEQVRRDTSHYLNYPPGQALNLGDVVVRDGGTWTVIFNLADRAGIAIKPVVSVVTDAVYSPTSSRGYDVSVKAKGKLDAAFPNIPKASAGAKITLRGEYAFALSMSGPSFERIDDVERFWDEVRAKDVINSWTWPLERRIVTSIVKCENVLFVSSASGESSFELEADAEVALGPAVPDLADLSAGLTLKSTMEGSDLFAGRGATPLFKAYRLKLLGGVGPASFDETPHRLEDYGPEPDDEY